MHDVRPARVAVLERCGAPAALLEDLLKYGETPYLRTRDGQPASRVLPDEPHVAAWLEYAARAREVGAFAALRERFVQLRFPIREGLSRDAAYRSATLGGAFEEADAFAPGAVPHAPDRITLSVVESMAGRVPVIVAGHRDDFELLVRAFTERNEPAPVPASMGACIVGGVNNWHRIARHREAWARTAEDTSEDAWQREFAALIPQKPLYQDRFIVLSTGPYSAVPAEQVGADPASWSARSLGIRREHELFHYFTYRNFGQLRTHVFDELLADFVGLVRTDGEYRAALALRFLGLEAWPTYRQGGRLENYVNGKLREAAMPVIAALAVRGSASLERIAAGHATALRDTAGLVRVVAAVCTLALDELASDEAPALVAGRMAA